MNSTCGIARAADDAGKVWRMLIGVTAVLWASWMIFAVAWLALGIVQAVLTRDPSLGGLHDEMARASTTPSHVERMF
jgi:hypothetical protein